MKTQRSIKVTPVDLYHVGIVVPDIEVGMSRLRDLLGVRWAPVLNAATPVRSAEGDEHSVSMRVVYSIDSPHLELIEEVQGTVWTCNPYSNLHHIGLWAPSLSGASERLTASGCPLEICGWEEGRATPQTFAYHRDPLGVRIELVDNALRGPMEDSWAGSNNK